MFLQKIQEKIGFLIGFEPTNQHVINTSQQRKKFIVQKFPKIGIFRDFYGSVKNL